MFMNRCSQNNRRPELEESSCDEICKSLKMFAAEIAFNLGEYSKPTQPRQSIDSIMEDFSKNGYHCDEMNQQKNRTNTKTAKNVLQVKGQLTKLPDLIDYKKPSIRYDKAEKLITPNQSCAFCENNKEPIEVVKSHNLRDIYGRVLCPKLRVYTCPICKASGDNAHTVKYCPKKPIITIEDTMRTEKYRLAKATYFKHGMKI